MSERVVYDDAARTQTHTETVTAPPPTTSWIALQKVETGMKMLLLGGGAGWQIIPNFSHNFIYSFEAANV